jgi:hypothetical protein
VPELDPNVIVGLVAVGVVALVALIVAVARTQARRMVESVAPVFELGTARRAATLPPAVRGLYQGYTCRYGIEHRSQYSPGGATLRIRVSSSLGWSASIQDAGSRLLVSVGILKDLAIGDDELDQKLRFAGSDGPVLTSLLGQQRARDALRTLAGTEGFASVTVRPQRTDVKWAPRRPDVDENPEVVRTRLSATIDLLVACGYPPLMG